MALVDVSAQAGDFNNDGRVDLADFTVWRDTLGQTGVGLAADANNDLLVSAADFEIFRANLGQAAALPTATPAPEPAAIALFAGRLSSSLGVRLAG